ncbi:hypothetical protein CC2G_011113 [Coprinopsis cinerea AmutBmut pab1-1]|nr:hypothetical protein CC2G_011113 [Coprinopsis cinerea AmutBmut pab1-1]
MDILQLRTSMRCTECYPQFKGQSCVRRVLPLTRVHYRYRQFANHKSPFANEMRHYTMSPPFATYPLTPFDSLEAAANLGNAWIVEGLADVEKVRAALDRLVSKWPVLAGRVKVLEKDRFQIRIPLGPLEDGYQGYGLTSAVPSRSLSEFIELPIPTFIEVPHASLFIPEERLKATKGASRTTSETTSQLPTGTSLTFLHLRLQAKRTRV